MQAVGAVLRLVGEVARTRRINIMSVVTFSPFQ